MNEQHKETVSHLESTEPPVPARENFSIDPAQVIVVVGSLLVFVWTVFRYWFQN